MKAFYRNIVTIGIFLIVMLTIVGTASAVSDLSFYTPSEAVPSEAVTIGDTSSELVTVGDTSNVGTPSSQTITTTVIPVDNRTTINRTAPTFYL